MSASPRYFQLRDHVDPGQPFTAYAVKLLTPRMRGAGIEMAPRVVKLTPRKERSDRLPGRILPGHRIVESTNPILSAALERSALLAECDPPTELQSREAGTLTNATGSAPEED